MTPGWYVHKPDVENRYDDNTHTHKSIYVASHLLSPEDGSGNKSSLRHLSLFSLQKGLRRKADEFSSTFVNLTKKLTGLIL